MNIVVEEPAVHPSGLRVFARPMHGYELVGRKISPTKRAAARVLTTPKRPMRPHSEHTGRSRGLMMPRENSSGDVAMRVKTSPGTNIAAVEALRTLGLFNRDQVAYLIAMAYESGLAHGRAYDQAELLATWAENHATPPTREERIAAEIAAYGPAKYSGGPVDFETGRSVAP